MKSFFSRTSFYLLICCQHGLDPCWAQGVILIESTSESWALKIVRKELLEHHNIPAIFIKERIAPHICTQKANIPLQICVNAMGELAFKSRDIRKLIPLQAFKRIKRDQQQSIHK